MSDAQGWRRRCRYFVEHLFIFFEVVTAFFVWLLCLLHAPPERTLPRPKRSVCRVPVGWLGARQLCCNDCAATACCYCRCGRFHLDTYLLVVVFTCSCLINGCCWAVNIAPANTFPVLYRDGNYDIQSEMFVVYVGKRIYSYNEKIVENTHSHNFGSHTTCSYPM